MDSESLSILSEGASLSEEEIERYSRQLILRGWSADFQYFLSCQHVQVAKSYPSAGIYLSAAGVGTRAVETTWTIETPPKTPGPHQMIVAEEEGEVTLEIAETGRTHLLPTMLSPSMREPFIGSLIALELLEYFRSLAHSPRS